MALALTCLAAGWAGAAADEPAGSIAFVARNGLVEANGTFHDWRVTRAEVDREDPSAGVVEVEIDLASIDTGIGMRDDHLRSADFFEVERWPVARVRVHDARTADTSEAGHPRYTARFDLRIRDVEKTVDGSFELIDASHVEGELTIDRTDWGVGSPRSRWNPLSVHDEVVIHYRAELVTP